MESGSDLISISALPAVTFQAFRASAHFELLAHWLQAPHVSRWWGDPVPVLQRAQQPGNDDQAIIAADNELVGYVRWQPVSLGDLAEVGITNIPAGSVDIDILIGKQEDTGRGIGSEALRLLLQQLRSNRGIPLAGMSTSTANHAAVRAYEKAGFTRRQRYTDPQFGECWIMAAVLR